MGTRVGDEYQWITWKQLAHITEHLSYGILDAGLTPDVQAEGTTYRFMGIQAKNRKEWQFVNLAGMYQKVTTIPMYDTLGPDAFRYICDQTEMTTIAVSADQIVKTADAKLADR